MNNNMFTIAIIYRKQEYNIDYSTGLYMLDIISQLTEIKRFKAGIVSTSGNVQVNLFGTF